ncbi:pyridoxine/pyridoxamine 5'-phosphate oxidase [Pseudonocardia sp. CA-107938]|uniref:pyridoxine/pyridoxamine 5'-phosphate oxidase n=1 Tax=Pseudonocardia sp. CA-107938 TaxID=3240021 RepID=UPI003D8E1588
MTPDDPLAVLAGWMADAETAGLPAPNAMVLATVGPDGAPHARTVLVTEIADGALRFHTSTPTQKTHDLAAHPRASGVFLWPALSRQVVVAGPVAELDRADTDAAFERRPEQLRRLAWVYDALLDQRTGPLQAIEPGAPERAFAAAPDAAAPPTWTTYALTAEVVELWRGQGPDAPAARTRHVRAATGWTHASVLP